LTFGLRVAAAVGVAAAEALGRALAEGLAASVGDGVAVTKVPASSDGVAHEVSTRAASNISRYGRICTTTRQTPDATRGQSGSATSR
jgi:hypothetical protein